MIAVNELRSGTTFTENNDIFQVIAYEHIKMGRGSANIKIKIRNLRTGSIIERGYTNGASVQDISLQNKILQYLYKDAETAYFMDPENYEQHEIPIKSLVGHEFLKEGENT